MFENSMAFVYHLSRIKAFSLFQKSEKTSVKLLILKLIYLPHFIWKQMDKVKLQNKRWKNFFVLLSTIIKMTDQKKQAMAEFIANKNE